MKRKELKNLAQKIAKAELICSSPDTTDKEKRAAELEIEKTYSRPGAKWGKIKDAKEFICLNFCEIKA